MKALMVALLLALVAPAFAEDPVVSGEFRVVRVRAEGVLVSGKVQEEPGKEPQVIEPWVLISGVPGKVEGDRFSAEVKRAGSYTFTDNSGSSRTIRKYELVKIQ